MSIRAAVRAAGKGADYSLFADFMMAQDGKAGAVHTYLLSPEGELVLVDFQNSHHEDFARIAPDSVARCAELSAVRIAASAAALSPLAIASSTLRTKVRMRALREVFTAVRRSVWRARFSADL